MSRITDYRRTTGQLSGKFTDFLGNVFTKENIQTGVQVVQQVTDKAKNGGTVSYGGTNANISGAQDYTNYFIIGGIGLAAIYFMNQKGKK